MKHHKFEARMTALKQEQLHIPTLNTYNLHKNTITAILSYEGVLAGYNGALKNNPNWRLTRDKAEWLEAVKDRVSAYIVELSSRSDVDDDFRRDAESNMTRLEWMYDRVTRMKAA